MRSMRIFLISLLFLVAFPNISMAQMRVVRADAQCPPKDADFGRMFPGLPLYSPSDASLVALALSMQDPNLPEGDNPSGVPSGFTYFFGQKADHDLTLDTQRLQDVTPDDSDAVNGRTPRLDLDSVYGGGRQGSPLLYDDQGRFRFSTPNGFEDFQRTFEGKAIISEGRNDENLVIAQAHLVFQKFHNRLINEGKTFDEARLITIRHWQYLVVNDFLREILGEAVLGQHLVIKSNGKIRVFLDFYDAGNKRRPMMPREFAVAAYRFGHSMVRLAYVMPTGSVTKTQVFNAAGNDLHGSRPIPLNLKIDWSNFFDIPGVPTPPGRNISRKIDALISKSLFVLPVGPVIPPDPPAVISLPERNLLRAKRLGLPSYQDVAVAMGITPYTNAQMGLTDPGLGGKAPLWFGILKESELATGGVRLGPTGAHIVAEVFLGILEADKDSYFNTPQPFVPMGTGDGVFHVADFLRFAGAI